MAHRRPKVALVNDYRLVAAGLSAMLEPFADRIELCGNLVIGDAIEDRIDLALYDTFGRQGMEEVQIDKLLADPNIAAVAIYSFNLDGRAIQVALDAGAAGYLSKGTEPSELVEQLEQLVDGQQVVASVHTAGRAGEHERQWPGQSLGLSERESEVACLAALGRRNQDIADALFVSIDTVKTHLSRSFRKLSVRNRTELSALVHLDPSFSRLLPDTA